MASRKRRELPEHLHGPQRLQRIMAAAGVGSRRECEQLIAEGRVEVDGEVVTEQGTKVDLQQQKVMVDGVRLNPPKLGYFMLNKPPGVVSTARDPDGRLRVVDLINTNLRVYNVGRLDKSSEGLILVTNDGDLANGLTHPRFGVEKVYHVLVKGYPRREDLEQLKEGVWLAEGKVQVAGVRIKKRAGKNTLLEMVLTEGRNREIRRLLARIGHKVLVLRRVAIGPLHLGDLPVGAHRRLTGEEVDLLRRAVAGQLKQRPRRGSGKPKPRSSGGSSRKKRESRPPASETGATRRHQGSEKGRRSRQEPGAGRKKSASGQGRNASAKPTQGPGRRSASRKGAKATGSRPGRVSKAKKRRGK